MSEKKNAPKITYSEPVGYFPKELRKKYGLGEFAKGKTEKKTTKTKKK